MQAATFYSFCPFEMGDFVKTKPNGEIKQINDIRTIHYLSTGTTDFELHFENSPVNDWQPLDIVIDRVK